MQNELERYLILGMPLTGKTTLAKRFSKKHDIPVLCADNYRNDWNLLDFSCGTATGIKVEKQVEFYIKLASIYDKYPRVILEGSSIYPEDYIFFNPDKVVLLSRYGITCKELLSDCRKHENKSSWTYWYDDAELSDLLKRYIEISDIWFNENRTISIDTKDFEQGIEKVIEFMEAVY